MIYNSALLFLIIQSGSLVVTNNEAGGDCFWNIFPFAFLFLPVVMLDNEQ